MQLGKIGECRGECVFAVGVLVDDIKDLILGRASSREIKKKAMEQGMSTLRRSGLLKIKAGVTSVEEVLRETVRDTEV